MHHTHTTFPSRLYWLHTITPLHIGAGQGIGAVDLPVVRERVTGWPYVPGSSVKGVLASVHGADDTSKRNACTKLAAAFGKASDNDVTESSGSLVFTDARLVCLPVRSLVGTFAWVTCPMALQRLQSDCKMVSDTPSSLPEHIPTPQADNGLLHCQTTQLKHQNTVYLEDLDFTTNTNADTTQQTEEWAALLANQFFSDNDTAQMHFKAHFAIVPNDIFQFFCTTALEVRARIKLEPESKTTASGALWYEESLPAESLLFGIAWCDKVYATKQTDTQTLTAQQLLQDFCQGKGYLQMGGKASTGLGLVRVVGLSTQPISQKTA